MASKNLSYRYSDTLVGIAAPYNVLASLTPTKSEKIASGAFKRVLSDSIPLLVDHDPNKRLGSVRLHDTADGLGYTFEGSSVNPDNYSGVSIGFSADESTIKTDGDIDTILDCALKEISLISKQPYKAPAYPCTSVSRRASERLSQWVDIHAFVTKNL